MNTGSYFSGEGRLSVVDPLSRHGDRQLRRVRHRPRQRGGGSPMHGSSSARSPKGVMEFNLDSNKVVRGAGQGIPFPRGTRRSPSTARAGSTASSRAPAPAGSPAWLTCSTRRSTETGTIALGECPVRVGRGADPAGVRRRGGRAGEEYLSCMALVITPAIVLSALRYSETSKIVRLATREHGVQSAIAKGALRPKSRFGAALQLLSEGQAQYLAKEHRELHVLTAFDLVSTSTSAWPPTWRATRPPPRLRRSCCTSPRPIPIPRATICFATRCMRSRRRRRPSVEALGFRVLWHLVSVLGFAPSLDACVRDGTLLPDDGALPFSTREGGALCPACAAEHGATQLPADARADLAALLDPDAALPTLDDRHGAAHRRLLARYVRYHLAEGAELPGARLLASPPLGGGMIIGTAGHIDHGKSALVAALTGQADGSPGRGAAARDHDRPQLRAARCCREAWSPGWWTCPGTRTSCGRWWPARRASISPCSSSPPTKASCRRRSSTSRCSSTWACRPAIPVVTKADLVEPEWLELVLAEVSERLARVTDRLRAARRDVGPYRRRPGRATRQARGQGGTARAASRHGPFPPPGGSVVLPGRRGHGGDGHGLVRPGRDRATPCRLLPSGGVGRVRSIESYGRALSIRASPARAPLSGWRGCTREAAQRGSWLVAADAPWQATRALDVELRAPGRRSAARSCCEAESACTLARPKSWPGCTRGRRSSPERTGLARLALEDPVVARGGDRLVRPELQPGRHDRRGAGARSRSAPPAHARGRPDSRPNAASERFAALLERRPGGLIAAELATPARRSRRRRR